MKWISKIKKWLYEVIEPFGELFLIIIMLCIIFFIIGVIAGSYSFFQDIKVTDWFAALSSLCLVGIGVLSWRTAEKSNSTANQVLNNQKNQDTYKNYLFHMERFNILISKLENKHKIKFIDSDELYSELFPSNCFSTFSHLSLGANDTESYLYDFSNRFTQKTTKYKDLFEKDEERFNDPFIQSDLVRNNKNLINFYEMLHHKCNELGFHIIGNEDCKKLKIDSPFDILISYSEAEPLKHQYLISEVYKALYKFSELKISKSLSLFEIGIGFTEVLEESSPFE